MSRLGVGVSTGSLWFSVMVHWDGVKVRDSSPLSHGKIYIRRFVQVGNLILGTHPK